MWSSLFSKNDEQAELASLASKDHVYEVSHLYIELTGLKWENKCQRLDHTVLETVKANSVRQSHHAGRHGCYDEILCIGLSVRVETLTNQDLFIIDILTAPDIPPRRRRTKKGRRASGRQQDRRTRLESVQSDDDADADAVAVVPVPEVKNPCSVGRTVLTNAEMRSIVATKDMTTSEVRRQHPHLQDVTGQIFESLRSHETMNPRRTAEITQDEWNAIAAGRLTKPDFKSKISGPDPKSDGCEV